MVTKRNNEKERDKPRSGKESGPQWLRSGRGSASALEALRRVEKVRDQLGRRQWPSTDAENFT